MGFEPTTAWTTTGRPPSWTPMRCATACPTSIASGSCSVDWAAHVLARHMRGQPAGVLVPGITLTRVLGLFRRHCHERLGYGEQSHKIRQQRDRPTRLRPSWAELGPLLVTVDRHQERVEAS